MAGDAFDGPAEGSAADDPADGAPRVPRPVAAACAVIALEASALLATAAILTVKTLTGSPSSVGRALSGAGLAAIGALVLGAAARSLYRLNPAARTPVVVVQLLALPVSYTLAFQAGRVGYGGPILLAALAVLYLVFTPPARAVLDREPLG